MASYTLHNVFEVHPCFNMCQQFIPFYCWIVSIVIDGTLSIHVSVDEYLFPFFLVPWVMLLWTFIFKYLCGHVFRSWVDTYRSVISLSYYNFVFNFWRNWQTVDCIILHFYQQHMRLLGLFLGSQCVPPGRLHFEQQGCRVYLLFSYLKAFSMYSVC